jgi:hypothetical protein
MWGVKLQTGNFDYLISLSGNNIVPQPIFSGNTDFALRVDKDEARRLVKLLRYHNFQVEAFQWT